MLETRILSPGQELFPLGSASLGCIGDMHRFREKLLAACRANSMIVFSVCVAISFIN